MTMATPSMTATDFIVRLPYDTKYLTIPTIDLWERKYHLAAIIRDHPDYETITMRCWYEGTLPEAPEPTVPFRLTRR